MALSYRDIKNNAHQFIIDYEHAVKENAESQLFLNAFFNIFGISVRRVASFERPVKTEQQGSTKRIDLFWRGKLLVEMKSTGQNLEKAYQQGMGYFKGLKDTDLPRYVMVCDLNQFRLYDLDDGKDYAFTLAELPDNLHLFDFMQGNEIEDIAEYALNPPFDLNDNKSFKNNQVREIRPRCWHYRFFIFEFGLNQCFFNTSRLCRDF